MNESDSRRTDALAKLSGTMMDVWGKMLPIGSAALRVVAPSLYCCLHWPSSLCLLDTARRHSQLQE